MWDYSRADRDGPVGHWLNRHLGILALLAGLALTAFSGCSSSTINPEDDEVFKEPVFECRLKLDKSKYRPGEMVRCTVEIVNKSEDDLVIVPPVARRHQTQSNLNFWFSTEGAMDVRRVVPVLPDGRVMKKMPDPSPKPIMAKGRLEEEDFFFTGLTMEPGKFRLQAHFKSSLHVRIAGRNIAISPHVEFEVKGKPKYRRNEDGFLLESEAIRVAKEAYGKLTKDGYAIIAMNDKGLYDWWVTLERMPYDVKPGEHPLIAFYVSPYGGFVREEAKPFLKPVEQKEPQVRQAPEGTEVRRPGGLIQLHSR